MTVICRTTITRIGAHAMIALEGRMLIAFREDVPADIEEYYSIHNHGEFAGPLTPGVELQPGNRRYPVTVTGEVTRQSLCELSHIILRFDDYRGAEFPGTARVAGPVPDAIATGYILKLVAQKERKMNQVATVIGGGQTLGELPCRGLTAEGCRVAVVDIQSEKASRVAQEINTEYGEDTAYGSDADATSEASVTALAHGVDEILTYVDLLVYSVGTAKAASVGDFALGDSDHSPQVDPVGYFLYTREFSRLMIRDGAKDRIIQIDSKFGKVGSRHSSGYGATKFDGVGLTQSLVLSLAEYGITVHSLMLGDLLKSPMFQSSLSQYAIKLGIDESEVEQYYIDKVLLERGYDYQDVLNVLMFYVSP